MLVFASSGFGDVFAKGIAVDAFDPEHAVMRHHSEVTAEAMGDGHSFAFGQAHGCALRDECGLDFARECACIVHCYL